MVWLPRDTSTLGSHPQWAHKTEHTCGEILENCLARYHAGTKTPSFKTCDGGVFSRVLMHCSFFEQQQIELLASVAWMICNLTTAPHLVWWDAWARRDEKELKPTEGRHIESSLSCSLHSSSPLTPTISLLHFCCYGCWEQGVAGYAELLSFIGLAYIIEFSRVKYMNDVTPL